ncbi:hypothetical protein GCM10027436_65730 [Actinophytocola sediminis]
MIAAIAAVLAAGLAVAGLFLPVHSLVNTQDDGERTFGYDFTWWGYDDTSEGDDAGVFEVGPTQGGWVLIAAAAVLVLAALFVFLAGRSVRPGVRTAGRSLLSAGVGVLVGASVLQLVSSLADLGSWSDRPLRPGEAIKFTIELGLYLPLGAVVLGLVAVVLAHRARPVRREPATPPMGFRMRQYGPGPMTGQQPALAGPGQSSGRFAPVPPGQSSGRFAPVPVTSTSDSTADAEQDPEITQRTTVHVGPTDAAAGQQAPAPQSPVQAALTAQPGQDGPTPTEPATANQPTSPVAAGLELAGPPATEPAVPTGATLAPPDQPAATTTAAPADTPSTAAKTPTAAPEAPAGATLAPRPDAPTTPAEPTEPATPKAAETTPAEPSGATLAPSGQSSPGPAEPPSQTDATPAAPTPAESTPETAPPSHTGQEPAKSESREPDAQTSLDAAPTPPIPIPPAATEPAPPSQPGTAPTAPSTPVADGPPSTPEPAPLAPLNLPPAPPAPELRGEDDKKQN